MNWPWASPDPSPVRAFHHPDVSPLPREVSLYSSTFQSMPNPLKLNYIFLMVCLSYGTYGHTLWQQKCWRQSQTLGPLQSLHLLQSESDHSFTACPYIIKWTVVCTLLAQCLVQDELPSMGLRLVDNSSSECPYFPWLSHLLFRERQGRLDLELIPLCNLSWVPQLDLVPFNGGEENILGFLISTQPGKMVTPLEKRN